MQTHPLGLSCSSLPPTHPQSGCAKFVDKINKSIADKKPFFSFEYFPPKTDEGLSNLYLRFDRMAALGPLFIDITWSAGGATRGKQNLTIDIASNAQNICCIDCNMHMTSNAMTRQEVIEVLQECKKNGVRNILALRGDPPASMDPAVAAALPTDFNYAVDLVRLIREEFGDYFGISVAGYPYLHSDCPSYEAGLQHLKEKVDAGADFVISQLFFQAEDFLKWVDDCRAIGITCPIIPGILPIQGYASLRNMTKMCSVPVPDVIKNAVEPIKDDDAAIKEFGIQYAADMCRKLIKGGVPGLHFYTLNREVSTERILIELGMIEENALSRALPWKKPLHPKRSREDVRPIFWANRQKSYLSRTAEWDDFPNGRWGDSRSPAFGELTDYHLFLHSREMKPEILRKMWGEELNGVSDVSRTFIRYLNGEIDQLPWSDNPPGKETSIIKTKLLKMNESGLWTINSQPRVNGVPSSDRSVGWGGPNGVVYQKAYIEFFTSPKVLEILLGVFKRVEPRINYQAVNMKGDTYSNLDGAVAVTWGVFPGAEIMQPTVVDPVSFHVWKEEAFTLWLARWAGIYPKESVSHQTLQSIHDNYFLVTIVDNDFINGDIFDVFDDVIDHISRLGEQRPLERAPSDSLLA